MNAALIKSMRDKANALDIGKWPEAALLMREAADELERLGRIEAELPALISSTRYVCGSSMCVLVADVRNVLEAKPCPTK